MAKAGEKESIPEGADFGNVRDLATGGVTLQR